RWTLRPGRRRRGWWPFHHSPQVGKSISEYVDNRAAEAVGAGRCPSARGGWAHVPGPDRGAFGCRDALHLSGKSGRIEGWRRASRPRGQGAGSEPRRRLEGAALDPAPGWPDDHPGRDRGAWHGPPDLADLR